VRRIAASRVRRRSSTKAQNGAEVSHRFQAMYEYEMPARRTPCPSRNV
jgi:hypothetical protein